MKQIITSPQAMGQFVQRSRKSKGLTQTKVGENFNIDQTTVSSIEQGAAGTRIDTLFRLLAALDLELVVQDKQSNPNKSEW